MGLEFDLGPLERFRSSPQESRVEKTTSKTSLKEWDANGPVLDSFGSKESEWDAIDLSKPVRETKPKTEKPGLAMATQKGELSLPKNGKFSTAKRFDSWAVELAKQERRMEKDQTVDFHNAFRKSDLLKAHTAEYISSLQERFREQIEIFNSARSAAAYQIHIYRVSKTEHDFMLFRNGVKMVVSAQQAGRILIAFNQYLGELFAPGRKPVFEVQAQWGVLDQLQWCYKGERLTADDLLRFFFTEFVRQSYR